jgi:hypothetical protein
LRGLASRYRFREQQLERKALFAERKPGPALLQWIIERISGYGERPWWAFGTYLVTIFFFAIIYFILYSSGLTAEPNVGILEALVLSVTSFHGRAFLVGNLPPSDWTAIVAAFEAIVGFFIEIVFIVSFSRRFLNG